MKKTSIIIPKDLTIVEFVFLDHEASILGIEKIRRDVVLCRLQSKLSPNVPRDKKRKIEVMKILEKNGRYFDRPISDVVTEMTRGRKHKCIVEFSWISSDHTSGTDILFFAIFIIKILKT